MRFGSVCSGIEAASCAWHPLGWETAFVSEIEPFPCSVLAHHYPTVPNLGDMTKFKEWGSYGIDVLVGGTPCQSFSVAGLRKGLDDPRGNLMLTYLAIADQYRPKWLVWENVPGVLSSNGGRDFGTFLGGLGELGYGFAYRVLDAQYLGVAQRRRRVFVVGCLGDWRGAAAVLFERHSLQGHPAPSRQAGQVAAKCLTRGANQRFDYETEDFVTAHTLRGEGFDASEDGTGRGTPLVPVQSYRTAGDGAVFDEGDKVAPLTTGTDPSSHILAFTTEQTPKFNDECALTLTKQSPTGGGQIQSVMHGMQVRRLTPVECERLQGFPDHYTNVPHRKKPAADGPRYKALGNSMAVPVMRWIGERIQAVESLGICKQEAA